MINAPLIAQWHPFAPWSDPSLVEQDMVLTKCLTCIMQHPVLREALAFRGGTALYKLHVLPAERYSEDLDFVRTGPGPIKPIIASIQASVNFLGIRPVIQLRQHQLRMTYRFQATSNGRPMRLKIEINTREHPAILPLVWIRMTSPNSLFSWEGVDRIAIRTYTAEELLATKWRALYQRKKGRDLFDVHRGCFRLKPDKALMWTCCRTAFERADLQFPDRNAWISNIEEKLRSPQFTGDVYGLLRPLTRYDPNRSWDRLVDQWLF